MKLGRTSLRIKEGDGVVYVESWVKLWQGQPSLSRVSMVYARGQFKDLQRAKQPCYLGARFQPCDTSMLDASRLPYSISILSSQKTMPPDSQGTRAHGWLEDKGALGGVVEYAG